MDIDSLKGKTIDDSTLAQLKSWAEGLTTRAETAEDKARKAAQESIAGRKTLKAERDAAFAKLGVDTLEELEAMPDPKGQADMKAQLDAAMRKLTRERDEAVKARDEVHSKLRGERRERVLAELLGGHNWSDKEIARVVISARLREDGDELLFEADGGKLMPPKDGVAWIAKTKATLLQSSGAGGSGFTGSAGAGGSGGAQVNPWAKQSFNLTEQMRLKRENPAMADQLKAQAGIPAVAAP